MTTAGAANPQDYSTPVAVTLYPQNPGQVTQQQRVAEQHYIAAGDSDKIAAASAPASAGGSAAPAAQELQADLHRQRHAKREQNPYCGNNAQGSALYRPNSEGSKERATSIGQGSGTTGAATRPMEQGGLGSGSQLVGTVSGTAGAANPLPLVDRCQPPLTGDGIRLEADSISEPACSVALVATARGVPMLNPTQPSASGAGGGKITDRTWVRQGSTW